MKNINHDFWMNLVLEIQKKIQNPVRIIFPNQLTQKYINWFFIIEKKAFRESLRYTKEEIYERFHRSKKLFFFLKSGKNPIALLLGYKEANERDNLFYLDTIATIIEKRGIGNLILKYLINWTKINGFDGIKLDTEVFTERGIFLKEFYEKIGFKLVDERNDGNITMEYRF